MGSVAKRKKQARDEPLLPAGNPRHSRSYGHHRPDPEEDGAFLFYPSVPSRHREKMFSNDGDVKTESAQRCVALIDTKMRELSACAGQGDKVDG